MIESTTDATFARDVRRSAVPVLVEFWAEWCGPCRMVAPVLEQIAREREGKLVIRRINADENPGTARDHHVLSLPSMVLFRDGEPVRTIVGARPMARLLAELDAALDDTR